MFEQIIFYSFGTMLLLSALMVISVRNPVYAALFLVLAFFSTSAIWLLLRAEFLAIVLVLVYVGAVMVLFLFVVMMLDINLARLRAGFMRYLPAGALVALVLAASMVLVVGGEGFNEIRESGLAERGPAYSNTAELGEALFTAYLYPLEIAGAILLVAIIAAIALTQRAKRETKAQNPDAQVAVRRQDRVRLVKMSSERDSE
ncbi:NADH-quinone oxidoreductase subunit J [Methylohalomonas lacus]|uniref:NADH-quinone oxidoreductase subunit J n=1 Tax=Methylohalomonas lacus TaxID=398773 RepID=A0AAE3HIE9_9GAMM|nr:NADH-quinone oxidoreductase subunit J [Methylohalomonas lacus]MCS3902910.1 NADH-quinone oxidoreductase subunit J [Methylohalomonas lacus]